jgi:hypothetical protein
MRKHLTGQDDMVAFDLMFTTKPPNPNASPREFEVYILSLADGLERGRTLTLENSVWLAKYLRGEVTLPKKTTGRPKRDSRKTIAITSCVNSLVFKGLTATRNDETKNDEGCQSACDAVAFAMVRLREVPQSYNEIKKLYFGDKRLTSELMYDEVMSDMLNGVGAKTPD